MKPSNPTRREFIRSSGSVVGGAFLTAQLTSVLALADLACTAHEARASFTVLTEVEAIDLEAIAEWIFPTDDTAGAREAGVIYFIDRAMQCLLSEGEIRSLRDGLVMLETDISARFGDTTRFSDLSADQQLVYLTSIEETEFFSIMRVLTITGMFSHPKYGGNRDKTGWNHLGFDDRHVWKPPFGYYDAQLYEEGDP